jgi:peptide/nickel transport system substrate-binding protein
MERASALGFAAALTAAPALAQELKIGLSAEPTSIDPHFHNLTPNNALRAHIFDALLAQDAEQKLKPALATSWRAVDETTWEFKLRPGVKFSNGMEFSARDAIYTVCRIPTVENSPSSMNSHVRGITAMEVPDPQTLIIKTRGRSRSCPSTCRCSASCRRR